MAIKVLACFPGMEKEFILNHCTGIKGTTITGMLYEPGILPYYQNDLSHMGNICNGFCDNVILVCDAIPSFLSVLKSMSDIHSVTIVYPDPKHSKEYFDMLFKDSKIDKYDRAFREDELSLWLKYIDQSPTGNFYRRIKLDIGESVRTLILKGYKKSVFKSIILKDENKQAILVFRDALKHVDEGGAISDILYHYMRAIPDTYTVYQRKSLMDVLNDLINDF